MLKTGNENMPITKIKSLHELIQEVILEAFSFNFMIKIAKEARLLGSGHYLWRG
jgi:16S rRNA G527 N7-methylase RsmG